MDGFGAEAIGALGLTNPAYALIAGVVLGVCITLCVLKWSPAPRSKADPLSGLFEGGTLESQLTRVADPKSQSEIEDRQASAVRAKIFARKSARDAAAKDSTPPHRAQRYDHAAVLAHVAKVMRAGTHLDDDAACATAPEEAGATGEWEEVLLLPPPSASNTSDGVAKAA